MKPQLHIVTLYNSPNCGAFLQAWALAKALGPHFEGDVSYIDTGARSTVKGMAADLKRSMRAKSPRHAAFALQKAHAHSHALRLLKVEHWVKSVPADDILIFGSDEIWNVSRERTIAAFPQLWGEGIKGGRRIAYAPSSNGATLDAFSGAEGLRRSLMGFDALSARDSWTASEISRVTGREVPVVCDPTLLLDAQEYRRAQIPAKPQAPYILVYSYGRKMAQADVEGIRAVAARRGLRLVSADFWLPWCDECVPCGPFGFLGLMDGAEAVITDTFHGTVLSIIYRKRFVTFSRANDKIVDLLGRIGLTSRDGSRADLSEIMARDVDWSEAEGSIASFRAESILYLNGALSLKPNECI